MPIAPTSGWVSIGTRKQITAEIQKVIPPIISDLKFKRTPDTIVGMALIANITGFS